MKNKIKLILVAGARPNFMKIAPLMRVLKDHALIKPILIHTGQHYDIRMSDLFFQQLNIPMPDINLEVGSASHAVQTARIMEGFEKVCLEMHPDMVMVVGDVNSTAACVMTAAKLGITTLHYEAGLRSGDRSMPEEINRLVTDAICDYFFTTSADADDNLISEGKKQENIFMVGNLMIDTLISSLESAKSTSVTAKLVNRDTVIDVDRDLPEGSYGVITFHRPSNVDDPATLSFLIDTWGSLSERIPLVFPIHPRTYRNIQQNSLSDQIGRYQHLYLIEPTGYLEFMKLVTRAKFTLTDSGGIQEETTYLDIPCLTVRPNTERPVTIWEGSNKLITKEEILAEVDLILKGKGKHGHCPKYWDGNSAKRIATVLVETLIEKS